MSYRQRSVLRPDRRRPARSAKGETGLDELDRTRGRAARLRAPPLRDLSAVAPGPPPSIAACRAATTGRHAAVGRHLHVGVQRAGRGRRKGAAPDRTGRGLWPSDDPCVCGWLHRRHGRAARALYRSREPDRVRHAVGQDSRDGGTAGGERQRTRHVHRRQCPCPRFGAHRPCRAAPRPDGRLRHRAAGLQQRRGDRDERARRALLAARGVDQAPGGRSLWPDRGRRRDVRHPAGKLSPAPAQPDRRPLCLAQGPHRRQARGARAPGDDHRAQPRLRRSRNIGARHGLRARG